MPSQNLSKWWGFGHFVGWCECSSSIKFWTTGKSKQFHSDLSHSSPFPTGYGVIIYAYEESCEIVTCFGILFSKHWIFGKGGYLTSCLVVCSHWQSVLFQLFGTLSLCRWWQIPHFEYIPFMSLHQAFLSAKWLISKGFVHMGSRRFESLVLESSLICDVFSCRVLRVRRWCMPVHLASLWDCCHTVKMNLKEFLESFFFEIPG